MIFAMIKTENLIWERFDGAQKKPDRRDCREHRQQYEETRTWRCVGQCHWVSASAVTPVSKYIDRPRRREAASGAYLLSDRGTWISFKHKADLVIAVQGDKRLFNQYGVILVNPAKHPHVKKELGQQFIDWLISDEGQNAIADYKIDGEQVFWPQRE